MKTFIKRHLPLLLGAAGFFLITRLVGSGCLILALTGFPCPTCGMTRAMLCLLRLDLAGYFRWQPMALPVSTAVWLLLHRQLLPAGPSRRWADLLSIAALIINLLLYLLRLR